MLLIIVACIVGVGMPAVAASSDAEKAQTVVHMLDYIGVDYPEFVQDGKVMNAGEYQEQREFATQSLTLLEQLPAVAGHAALLNDARQLLSKIDAKAAGSEVSALSGKLRADIISAYKLNVVPRQTPDLAQGARLFAAQCAACHGAQGHGDGPLAKGMEPSPSDFHDEARMTQRSLYGLYNTISLGVDGTPMRAFSEFSEADRWALAFFVGSVRSSNDSVAKGEAAWRQGEGKTLFTGMQSLVTLAPNEIADKGGNLEAVRAYLTRHPDAVQAAKPAPLDFTRARLEETEQAYRKGDREAALQLAIAAYLEGFELVESALDNVDAPLRADIEREMMALRAAVGDGKPADTVAEQVKRINALLERAEEKLSGGNLSPTAAFVSSLLILLREGLEAILVLSAITAFVVKTGRRDALPYIHAGWMGAVVLGIITWLAARYVLSISGANRELTEGFTALLAAAMLLYVGYWLHSRSNAQAWQNFIRDHVNSALSKRTLWAMAGISFLAVYRELFEVILFYETLWAQVGADGQGEVIGGIVTAAILLVLLGGGILRYSVRLPIGPFFAATSGLLAFMAIVFVGNGVAALQEAGVLPSTFVNFFSLPLLGIHPTSQGLSLQALTLLLVVSGLWLNRGKGT
jgi:high-affinity iron transporter